VIKPISLFSVLLVSSSLVQAACPNKVDPKKVVLFVDTNFSDLEIKHAEMAACKRGERLQVVPKNYKDYSQLIATKEIAQKKYWDCMSARLNPCNDLNTSSMDAEKKYYQFQDKQQSIPDQLKATLEEIKAQEGKIKSFAVSGHNGGGSFSGAKGHLGRQEVGNLIAQYPEINEVSSLLLLGCYTGVKNEVSNWKSIFPKVSLIAGYDGSAPAYSRPQGHQYIEDILVKEKNLTALKDVKKINSMAKSLISSIDGLNSAVYLKTMCKEDEEGFYYSSMGGREFDQLKLSECEKAMIELRTVYSAFQNYESGEVEPPKDTVNGNLRKIYNKVRANEHCLESDYSLAGINSHKVFNMLFLEGVKKNFAEYYQDDLKEAEEIIASINPDDIIKAQEEQLRQLDLELKSKQNKLDEYKKDPTGFLERESKALMQLSAEAQKMLDDPKTKMALDKVQANYIAFTPEENLLITQYRAKQFEIEDMSKSISWAKRSPDNFLQAREQNLAFLKSNMSMKMLNVESLKKNPAALKDVWVPNSANLATKTRKELMSNLHQMQSLTYMGGITPKQTAALSWVQQKTSSHLVYYENPFSWHEYVGKPEVIPNSEKLQDRINSYGAPFIMSGGGMSGRSTGGSYGGGGQQQPQQQVPQPEERPMH
jgi:hypothetical protein